MMRSASVSEYLPKQSVEQATNTSPSLRAWCPGQPGSRRRGLPLPENRWRKDSPIGPRRIPSTAGCAREIVTILLSIPAFFLRVHLGNCFRNVTPKPKPDNAQKDCDAEEQH